MNETPELFFTIDLEDVVSLVLGVASFVIATIVLLVREWLDRRRVLRERLRDSDE